MERKIGIANIFTEDLNGLLFSLMGMLIVFIGLVVLCLYIVVLPHILEFINKRKDKIREKARRQLKRARDHYRDPKQKVEVVPDNEEDILVAIATALHLEHSFLSDNQKYTWKDELNDSYWKVAGKMNSLTSRKSKTTW